MVPGKLGTITRSERWLRAEEFCERALAALAPFRAPSSTIGAADDVGLFAVVRQFEFHYANELRRAVSAYARLESWPAIGPNVAELVYLRVQFASIACKRLARNRSWEANRPDDSPEMAPPRVFLWLTLEGWKGTTAMQQIARPKRGPYLDGGGA